MLIVQNWSVDDRGEDDNGDMVMVMILMMMMMKMMMMMMGVDGDDDDDEDDDEDGQKGEDGDGEEKSWFSPQCRPICILKYVSKECLCRCKLNYILLTFKNLNNALDKKWW